MLTHFQIDFLTQLTLKININHTGDNLLSLRL